jgi:hypothetical protein
MGGAIDRARLWPVTVPLLIAGCAAAPPHAPSEFELARARIETRAELPQVKPSPDGKAEEAVQGAAVGAMVTGLSVGLAAAVPCLILGPLAGPCFAMVPAAAATGTTVGAASGALIGASASDSAEVAQAKRALLEFAVATRPLRERLVTHLQRQARESAKVELPVAPAGAPDPPPWRIGIGALTIDADAGKDGPYRLRAKTGLTVTRTNEERPAFSKRYEAVTPTAYTTSEWQADDAAAALAALDDLMATLAAAMLADLQSADPGSAGVLWTRTHYKESSFSLLERRMYATVTKVDGIENLQRNPINLTPGRHSIEVGYARESYLCGYLGCIEFEQARRSFELVAEQGHSYLPFARRLCDMDWIGLLDTGKSAREDIATWTSVGNWSFGDLKGLAPGHVVVAGDSPPATCSSP